MNSLQDETSLKLRRTIYVLLAVTALGAAFGRIMQVRASTGETPMLSANDRSRWCTIAALVNEGTYAIDSLIERRHSETNRRYWYSIDMVRHRAADGREHAYSSKPPLLPTLLAGEYWLIKKTLTQVNLLLSLHTAEVFTGLSKLLKNSQDKLRL